MLRGCLNGSLTAAKSLKAAGRMFDKGEIVEVPPEVSKSSLEITALANPEKRQEAVKALVDVLVKSGKSVDDIDEMFSQVKMEAISHAEQAVRENGEEKATKIAR